MTTLAKNSPRIYDAQEEPSFNDLPAVASDIIYEGAAVGDSSGNGRPLVAADTFQGFADRKCDNSAGAAGDKKIHVRQRGVITLSVTGVTGVSDEGSTVYATDDDTFTLTASGASAIGKVKRFVSGTTVEVYFESASLRSI